jgi:hypothetical protein
VKWFLIIFSILCVGLSNYQAQRLLLPVWASVDSVSSAGFYSHGFVGSDGFNNRFVGRAFLGSELDRSTREAQYERLAPSMNRLGGGYSVGFQGKLHPFTNRCFALDFSFTDEAFGEAVVTQDAFGLVFFGNQRYAGDTINLGGNHLRAARFQKFGFGISYQGPNRAAYGLMLSFVNGESSFKANIPSAWLYTSERGDTLSARLWSQVFATDTGNMGFMRNNGAGAMVDFHLAQDVELGRMKWRAEVMVMNLGLVQWKPSTSHYRADTLLQWTGIGLNDVLTIEEEVNAFSFEDSLNALIYNDFGRSPVNQVIPGWMQLELNQLVTKGFGMGMGITFRPEAAALPYFYAVPGYHFGKHLELELECGYGGYGTIQTGFAAVYNHPSFLLRMRASNMEAILAPGTFGGLTLAASIQYRFKG